MNAVKKAFMVVALAIVLMCTASTTANAATLNEIVAYETSRQGVEITPTGRVIVASQWNSVYSDHNEQSSHLCEAWTGVRVYEYGVTADGWSLMQYGTDGWGWVKTAYWNVEGTTPASTATSTSQGSTSLDSRNYVTVGAATSTFDLQWLEKVYGRLNLLPVQVLEWLQRSNFSIYVTDESLASKYGYKVAVCGISHVSQLSDGSKSYNVEIYTSSNGVDAVIHEIGHCISYSAGVYTPMHSSEAFLAACAADSVAVSNNYSLNMKSYTLNGSEYYNEYFAEVFNLYVTKSSFRTTCPNLTAYFDSVISNL